MSLNAFTVIPESTNIFKYGWCRKVPCYKYMWIEALHLSGFISAFTILFFQRYDISVNYEAFMATSSI